MNRLLIVSNRLPVNVIKKQEELQIKPSIGGLATGLGSFYKSYKSTWIGWPGVKTEDIRGREKDIESELKKENCYPVFLSKNNIENYYYGFCNKTIWPLFHYLVQYTRYDNNLWESYKEVNESFCEAVCKVAEQGDIIWIHDYQLMLLPELIRERKPDATIGFFLHIPFPSYEIFRLLPWRNEIMDGLLGADLVGFHTYGYARHFLESVSRLTGYEQSFGQITAGNRAIKADIFPMGIDYKRFSDASNDSDVQKEIKKIQKKIGERKLILSFDRLDYTKGIPPRLESYDLFLENNPEYKEKVTFIMVAVPSRTGIDQYRQLKRQVDELAGKINGKHATVGWTPIWYLYRTLPFSTLLALYNASDVALITPARDGMNLIAKEFIATKNDGKGVLILSEMAGAAEELGEAVIVNPNNKEEVANALKEALMMPEEEQIERNKIMQKRLLRYNVSRWADDFMEGVQSIKEIQQELSARILTHNMKNNLINNYLKSSRRLILLDYDGTLTYFTKNPKKAKPDKELLELLEMLAGETKNEVVIISGRDKETLDNWFCNLDADLVAEHGAWIKEKDKDWGMIEPLKNDWKEEIRPFLERYVDRTPGSFIEEKEFSLVWHYRKVDPELATLRAGKLKNDLLHITANLYLTVLEGSKVIEIKNSSINKGRAASYFISKNERDFILAAGDDWTDEDVFDVLPDIAYSIKVGLSPSKARFNVGNVGDVRSLLKDLIDNKTK